MQKAKNVVFNSKGGADYLLSHFREIGIISKINKILGRRMKRAVYSYGDAIMTWTINALSGSRRMEHICRLQEQLKRHPKFKKGMSPDSFSRICRELAVENKSYNLGHAHTMRLYRSGREISDNETNYNRKMNTLTLDLAISLGLFKKGCAYELDIDATVVETEVSDNRKTYMDGVFGYSPLVVMLNGIPIMLESRGGNTSPKFRILEVLQKSIEIIESRGIQISLVRSDSAGCTHDVISYLITMGIKFIIRANQSNEVIDYGHTFKWEQVELDSQKLSATSRSIKIYRQNVRQVSYKRSMVFNNRHLENLKQDKIFGINTNLFEASTKEIIEIYNRRGKHERRFSDLKELGWNYMPHRNLKNNTVFLHLTLIAYVFFVYSKRLLSGKVCCVKETMEPLTFLHRFIEVITSWDGYKLIFHSRQKEYQGLMGFG